MRGHLKRRYGLAAIVLVGASLTAGCGGDGDSADAATVSTPAPSTAAGALTLPPLEVPASGIALTGDLKDARTVTLAQLKALKQTTYKGSFSTHEGKTTRTWKGPLLRDLVPLDDLATTSDRKHDELTFAIVVRAADNFSVTLAWGEISPEFENKDVMVALFENGKALKRPRLVVPGDKKAARQMFDLTELRFIRLR